MVPETGFDGRRRVIIEAVSPSVDDGRFPAKRVVGDVVLAEADIFADGHDVLSAVMLWRHRDETESHEVRALPRVNDRWRAEFPVGQLGFYEFSFQAWVDHFLTWHRDLRKRIEAQQPDLDVQLRIGAQMIRAAGGRAAGRDRTRLQRYAAGLEGDEELADKLRDADSDELLDLMWRNSDRAHATRTEPFAVEVDRPRAGFSTWYELFPRSASSTAGAHGTFRDVEAQLPRLEKMGFDVLYLPPVHPIGRTFRKGRNNAINAAPHDVGSPWAIGSDEGGHHDVHPQLGTIEDFRHLVAAAAERRIEVAIDIAFQTSPDHPWVREHEDWFRKRPDGTIQYAENPPKQYQDIYPFDFDTEAWRDLWDELCGVLRFWIGQGVRIFRVDNPHTKPLPFWQWVIRETRNEHPDVLFLAEAFTRPKIMHWLAKAGFAQSYTYFAWRNTKSELTSYFTEITRPPVSEFFRPNAWPNTPDILTEYLQYGGRPAFIIRLILAATLSANYGIYGPAFERLIAEPRESGSEEYRDSEKYEIRPWPRMEDDLSELIARINRIRRDNPALQQNASLRFHPTTNDEILCYSKSVGEDSVVTVVNVDPHNTQSGWVELDLGTLQVDANRPFQVHELLSGARYTWHGARNYVQLDPHVVPAHIFRIRRKVRSERDFEYFL